MTLEELNALFDLRAELEELTEIRRSLMDAATKTTTKLTARKRRYRQDRRACFRDCGL